MEETGGQLEEGNPGKKKRKKRKKKAKSAGENEDASLEEAAIYQDPPKLEVIKMLYSVQKYFKIFENCRFLDAGLSLFFQDEEEFPGLSPALNVNERLLISSSVAKLCKEVHSIFFFSFRCFPPFFGYRYHRYGFKLYNSSCVKLDLMKTSSQENQREGVQPQPVEQNKEKPIAATAQPIEMAKKGQVRVCLFVF